MFHSSKLASTSDMSNHSSMPEGGCVKACRPHFNGSSHFSVHQEGVLPKSQGGTQLLWVVVKVPRLKDLQAGRQATECQLVSGWSLSASPKAGVRQLSW